MIKWLKRSQNNSEVTVIDEPVGKQTADSTIKTSLFAKFKQGLGKTRSELGEGIANLLLGKKELDAALIEELETVLIRADLGFATTNAIIASLQNELKRKHIDDSSAVYKHLQNYLHTLILTKQEPLVVDNSRKPYVILLVGVNGAGKTTTIGKLAQQFKQQGKKVMLAAGDTFRAAAVEQLKIWGERNEISVIAQHTGADSASVIYDALQAAKSRHVDVLIADTAGRLHNQNNLMDELKKVKKVMQKLDQSAPHETMLVLDASIGQNALNQAQQFHDAIGITGITMTKLDGTARGGILFAIANALDIPFRYVGIGEGIDDLRVFDAQHFVNAIFADDRI